MKSQLLANVGTKIATTASVAKLKLIKNGPTISVVVGTGLLVASGIIACKKSYTKAHVLIEEHKKNLEEVKYARDNFDEKQYSEKDYTNDLVATYLKTGLKFIKLYAVPIIIAATGITAILVGHKKLRARNLAISSALAATQQAFDSYKDRVKEEVGEEKEYEIRTNKKKKDIAEAKEKKDLESDESKLDSAGSLTESGNYSPYARIFDEANEHYDKDPVMNQFFLKSRQNYWNDILNARKSHVVFLNEVLNDLGYDMTQDGALVGWYKFSDNGDGYIDFGYQADPDFMQGNEASTILDFNIDPGIVYDQL